MIAKLSMRASVVAVGCLAAAAALAKTASAQSAGGWDEDRTSPSRYSAPYDPSDALDGTYDRQNTGDDWFYDAYVFDEDAIYRPYTYDYDWDENRFDWEEGQRRAYPQRGTGNQQQRMKQTRAVSGEILASKRVSLPDQQREHLVALIATDRGNARLVIDFGPVDRLRRSERQSLQRGEQIEAQGPVKVIGGANVLMAKRVQAGDEQFRIDRPSHAQKTQPQRAQMPRDPYGADEDMRTVDPYDQDDDYDY